MIIIIVIIIDKLLPNLTLRIIIFHINPIHISIFANRA